MTFDPLEPLRRDAERIRKALVPKMFRVSDLPEYEVQFYEELEEEVSKAEFFLRVKDIPMTLIHLATPDVQAEIHRTSILKAPVSATGEREPLRGVPDYPEKGAPRVVIPREQRYKFKRVIYPYRGEASLGAVRTADTLMRGGLVERLTREQVELEYGSMIPHYIEPLGYAYELEWKSLEPVYFP